MASKNFGSELCLFYIFSLSKNQVLACLSISNESSVSDQKETTSSTRSESVTIKRKIRNTEEPTEDDCSNSEAYGTEQGEKRVKQSTEKNLKAKVFAKAVSKEQKSLTKTGLSRVRINEFCVIKYLHLHRV